MIAVTQRVELLPIGSKIAGICTRREDPQSWVSHSLFPWFWRSLFLAAPCAAGAKTNFFLDLRVAIPLSRSLLSEALYKPRLRR